MSLQTGRKRMFIVDLGNSIREAGLHLRFLYVWEMCGPRGHKKHPQQTLCVYIYKQTQYKDCVWAVNFSYWLDQGDSITQRWVM